MTTRLFVKRELLEFGSYRCVKEGKMKACQICGFTYPNSKDECRACGSVLLEIPLLDSDQSAQQHSPEHTESQKNRDSNTVKADPPEPSAEVGSKEISISSTEGQESISRNSVVSVGWWRLANIGIGMAALMALLVLRTRLGIRKLFNNPLSALVKRHWGWTFALVGLLGTLASVLGIRDLIMSPFRNAPILKMIRLDKQQVLAGDSVTITALTDRDSNDLSYDWTNTGGHISGNKDIVKLDTTGVDPYSTVSITVGVTVKDKYRKSDEREIIVPVIPPHMANSGLTLKTIKADPQVNAGEKVRLIAIAEDQYGDKLTYNWANTAGRIEMLNADGNLAELDTSGMSVRYAPVSVGIELTIKCSRGASVSKEISISVIPQRPLVSVKQHARTVPLSRDTQPILIRLQAENASVQAGDSVRLQALARDSSNEKLNYEWETSDGVIDGGGQSVVLRTGGINIRANPMVVTVTLTVRNTRGGSISGNLFVTVAPVNRETDKRLTFDRY